MYVMLALECEQEVINAVHTIVSKQCKQYKNFRYNFNCAYLVVYTIIY